MDAASAPLKNDRAFVLLEHRIWDRQVLVIGADPAYPRPAQWHISARTCSASEAGGIPRQVYPFRNRKGDVVNMPPGAEHYGY